MDAALRNTLRHRAKPPARGTPSESCDAELAAAYVEGRLRRQERERFETHMAQCSGCRALTAALAEELLPEAPEAAPARSWWSWRWAAPALAGVAIVGSVIFYQREQVLRSRVTPPPAPAAKIEAPAPAPVAVAPATATSGAKPAVQPRKVVARRAATPPQTPPVVKEPVVKEKEKEEVAISTANPPAPAAESAATAAAPAAVGGVAGGFAPAKAAERQQAAAHLTTTRLVGDSAADVQASTLAPLPDGAVARAILRREASLWAVSDGGRIFRSLDNGRTWTKIKSPTTADLISIHWDPQANLLVVRGKQGSEYRVKP